MRAGLAAAAGLVLFAVGMSAQSPAVAVSFEMEHPGLQPPHWRMTLDAAGDGSYEELPAGAAAAVTQKIHVSAETLRRLDAGSRQASTRSCETKLKNIAKMGKKTIEYRSAGGEVVGACSFNMADDAGLNDATMAFLGLKEMVREGQRLAFAHRFDRLGLDAEMDKLMEMIQSHSAIEVRNIGPVLESIANDDQVLQRVRMKALRLLKQAQVES